MLTRTLQNAADLISALNKTPGLKLKDFCAERNLSTHFIEQIGLKLVKAKILYSKRGPGGGYSIRKINPVTMRDLVMSLSNSSKVDGESELSQKVFNALETVIID